MLPDPRAAPALQEDRVRNTRVGRGPTGRHQTLLVASATYKDPGKRQGNAQALLDQIYMHPASWKRTGLVRYHYS